MLRQCRVSVSQGALLLALSSQLGPFTSTQKGKGLSPLQRVFNSPKNQYMQHDHQGLSLPSIEEFLDDYIGSSSQCFDMPNMIPAVDSLTISNSTGFCGSVSETSSLGGSQLTQERDTYQWLPLLQVHHCQNCCNKIATKTIIYIRSSHCNKHKNNITRTLTIA